MSATLMGAVMVCGPKKGSMRYVLVAIADNADDYGFACPSIETIADKACCDERTAMRLVQSLEREGWMVVHRRVLGGKGSIYFLNLDKLGATVGAKSRKSPLHVEMEKLLGLKKPAAPPPPSAPPETPPAPAASGDNLSPESEAPAVDPFVAPEKSGDNPQGVQVTKTAESGDKSGFPILKNRCEPLVTQASASTPLPPSKSRGASAGSKTNQAKSERHVCEEAVTKVMRECDISDPRMAKVISRAIALEHSKTDAPANCNATAELMIRHRRLYLDEVCVMRCPPGVRKFFAHGLWANRQMWPYDEEKLNRARRL